MPTTTHLQYCHSSWEIAALGLIAATFMQVLLNGAPFTAYAWHADTCKLLLELPAHPDLLSQVSAVFM